MNNSGRDLRRRTFLAGSTAAALSVAMSSLLRAADSDETVDSHIATNTYPWLTFANRAKRKFDIHSEPLLAQIASTGITGYEPIINKVDEFQGLAERLKKNGLQMRSIYVNSVLHDKSKAEKSIADVITIAKAARKVGTKIVVTNPSPIQWGSNNDKDDQQLRLQAKSLDRLGGELRQLGVTLAYHNHDAELRQGAREFHHMLTATSPDNVKLCLDAHWIYRGCGDSEVAVFDALHHYHQRIIELHLRQSEKGIWTEEFKMQGDIDYTELFDFLATKKIVPHVVLEQAVEGKSTKQLTAVEAHRLGRQHLDKFV